MAKQIDAATLAALAAFKGKVTKVAPDATAGLSHRDWYKAARGEVTNGNAHVVRVSENTLIEQRIEVAGGVQNGLGEWIYQD